MSGSTRVSRYQKGKTKKIKTNLDLLQQEIVSGSGICCAICKSAPHPRQPRQHPTTQFFYRPDALPATQPTASKHWRQKHWRQKHVLLHWYNIMQHNNNTHLMASFPGQSGKPVYQKGKTILDFHKARDGGWQWHQLDHMQIICTSLQTDNHANTSSLDFFTGQMLFLSPKYNAAHSQIINIRLHVHQL